MWVPSNDQIGTCLGEGFRSLALAGLGTMGVLGAPVSHHDHDINSLVERLDVGGNAPECRTVERTGTWWHVESIGSGASTRRRGRLADGVDREEAYAYAVSFHDHGAAGRGQIVPGSDGVDLRFREAGERLAQGAVAVITSVIVG